jgi:hypothetical protein
MKTKFILMSVIGALAIVGTGCSGIPKIVENLGKDQNTVFIRGSSPMYGVNFFRTGATNLDITISPDGTVTMKKAPDSSATIKQ